MIEHSRITKVVIWPSYKLRKEIENPKTYLAYSTLHYHHSQHHHFIHITSTTIFTSLFLITTWSSPIPAHIHQKEKHLCHVRNVGFTKYIMNRPFILVNVILIRSVNTLLVRNKYTSNWQQTINTLLPKNNITCDTLRSCSRRRTTSVTPCNL